MSIFFVTDLNVGFHNDATTDGKVGIMTALDFQWMKNVGIMGQSREIPG